MSDDTVYNYCGAYCFNDQLTSQSSTGWKFPRKKYDDGQDINPNLIFEWALKNDKWLDRDAKKLREVSQSIFNGTNPRTKYKIPEDIIKKFHDECTNKWSLP